MRRKSKKKRRKNKEMQKKKMSNMMKDFKIIPNEIVCRNRYHA
jgi:hypothetical protein